LALSQEDHLAESCGNEATAKLKRLLESLFEKANQAFHRSVFRDQR
jgi:hypothetical protein